MIGPIKTVAVYVSNQAVAQAFWVDKLGFKIRKELAMTPEASWIEAAPPGAESALVLYPRSMMNNWQELKPSIVFHCPDVEAAVTELDAKGVTIVDQPKQMQWGTYAKFADPDGNEFLLASTSD
jgi:predicted enzyme related to lactoylglutathione lyase